jgi:hypothetical protein
LGKADCGLYRLVEDGVTDLDDVLKDRLNSLKADRDRAKAALETAKAHVAPQIRIGTGNFFGVNREFSARNREFTRPNRDFKFRPLMATISTWPLRANSHSGNGCHA